MAHLESLKLDFELLVAALIGRVDNHTLGLFVRGLAWAADHKRTYIPAGVLRALDDDSDEAVRALVDCGLLLAPDGRQLCHFAEGAWRMCNVGRIPIPEGVRAVVYARDGHRCQECGSPERLTVDHCHPVALGGGDELDNLRTLCRSCNSRKGAKV
ncbi:HNH endonuclease [Streptacidiphilus carbonis]|uniref:HNH endonuclease n=1 Tax=Streptacidiphilus carbonis TaxID=105422 RepID=UPI000AAAD2E9|nr:HNH endonuclease [Streptacidiphilus carbonis]